MTGKIRRERQPAAELPIARVCVDVPLPHLDRLFDYQAPADLDAAAQAGTRVKVRFAGQLVDGWLIERTADTAHSGRLAWLEKVVSPEPVLRPEIAALARQIADRYAGGLADVLRLAVPPRQAAVEKEKPAPLATPSQANSCDSAAAAAAPSSDPPDGADSAAPAGEGSGEAPDSDASAGAGDRAAPAGVGLVGGADVGDPTAFAGDADVAASSGGDGPAGGTDSAALGGGGFGDSRAGLCHGANDVVPEAGWGRYPAGVAFLRALVEGRSPRAVWSAMPAEAWPERIAEAVQATLHSGRGSVVVVADARDLSRLDAALLHRLGAGRHVALSAALGPAERYRRFLRVSRGQVRVAIGTRAAAFAPVADLGLVAIWDDGDDMHAEPRSPYPHARQVLLTRAQAGGAAALVGGFARTAEAQHLLATGWAKEIAPAREALRAVAPDVRPADDKQLARDPAAASARLPSLAWQAARHAVSEGKPVLIQVPRRGYVPAVACQECRERARCPHCAGPLALGEAGGPPTCRWCARPAAGYTCPACGGRRLRASVTGVRRTAEEIGRALPGVPVWTSGGDSVLDHVAAEAALVLATPGAEPVAEGGYGAVLLLDAWALLTRSDLRAGEETARRWFSAAALAAPRGRVVVVADGGLAPVQALIRWDPGWLAERELAERRELGFPPAARIASLTGSAQAVSDLLDQAGLPEGAELLGPLPVGEDQERMLVRVRLSQGLQLAEALHAAAGARSARKGAEPVRIQLDPTQL